MTIDEAPGKIGVHRLLTQWGFPARMRGDRNLLADAGMIRTENDDPFGDRQMGEETTGDASGVDIPRMG